MWLVWLASHACVRSLHCKGGAQKMLAEEYNRIMRPNTYIFMNLIIYMHVERWPFCCKSQAECVCAPCRCMISVRFDASYNKCAQTQHTPHTFAGVHIGINIYFIYFISIRDYSKSAYILYSLWSFFFFFASSLHQWCSNKKRKYETIKNVNSMHEADSERNGDVHS